MELMKIYESKDLTIIAKSMRKAGISHLKTADFEITLDPKFTPSTRRIVSESDDQKNGTGFPVEIADEDMLFYSVPDFHDPSQRPMAPHEEEPTHIHEG